MTKTLDYEVEQLHFDGPALADYLIRQMQQRTRDKEAEERGMKRGIEQGIEQGMKQGMKRGIEQGIEQGTLSTLSLLVNDGTISIEKAASMANLTKDEFEFRMKDAL